MNRNRKEILIPAPKIFESGKYFMDMTNNLIHFKTLENNSKKNILKFLNMEVIIMLVYYFNFLLIKSL